MYICVYACECVRACVRVSERGGSRDHADRATDELTNGEKEK